MRVPRTRGQGPRRRRSAARKALAARDLPAFAALVAAVLLAASPAAAEVTDPAGIGGRVLGAASPLPAATVYAYQLTERSHRRVVTDGEGGFLFDALPAGLYKIVAYKPGFVPVVLHLTRATADAYQYLELQLAEAAESAARGESDFWSVQAEIPPDVLRDMRIARLEADTRAAGWTGVPRAAFQTALRVESGVDDIAAGGSDAHLTGGSVGIDARLGTMRLGLSGDYRQLAPARAADARGGADAFDGQRSALSLEMANGEHTWVNLSSTSDHMTGGAASGSFAFEQHRLSLSHALGVRSRSQLIAQYTAENNYHRLGWIEPAAIPEASQSWRVEGSYEHEFSHRSSLETGFRYRQLESVSFDGGVLPDLVEERVDLYGRGGLRVQPAVVVQYGLYTTLLDGTVSLIPQGGLVFQLAPTWQASLLASHRFDDGEPASGFVPAYFAETGECDQNEAQCYQLVLTHQRDDDHALSVGATHREYGEVERVYFDDEGFLDRFESLYLVPGDRVPELQFSASRRLTPTVVARFESSVGAGGGGIFRGADQSRYENEVNYLVTSLDTRFQATSTGVYLAFHHLRQALGALDAGAAPVSEVEVERLQVRVTQDLAFLRELAADWALKLDMELSRGASPYDTAAPDDEIRRRLLGGIAVSF